MTASPIVQDPHGLLAAGAELASLPELVELFDDATPAMLRAVVSGRHYTHIRFITCADAPRRYCVADVRAAYADRLPGFEARRQRAAEREASEREAREAKLAAKAAAAPKPSATAAVTAPVAPPEPKADAPPARPAQRQRQVPEIYIRRRPGAPGDQS